MYMFVSNQYRTMSQVNVKILVSLGDVLPWLRVRQVSCHCTARPDTFSWSPGAALWQCFPFGAFFRIRMEGKTPQSVWSNLKTLPRIRQALRLSLFSPDNNLLFALIFIFLLSQRNNQILSLETNVS